VEFKEAKYEDMNWTLQVQSRLQGRGLVNTVMKLQASPFENLSAVTFPQKISVLRNSLVYFCQVDSKSVELPLHRHDISNNWEINFTRRKRFMDILT
jgi:hypothetical protein